MKGDVRMLLMKSMKGDVRIVNITYGHIDPPESDLPNIFVINVIDMKNMGINHKVTILY